MVSEPRSCAFCDWNGDVGATAHATIVHPDKEWLVLDQFGHEFVLDAAHTRPVSGIDDARLRDDIAAMLHYRGRVMNPRTHTKAVGGPCDECIESARQAVEFVTARLGETDR